MAKPNKKQTTELAAPAANTMIMVQDEVPEYIGTEQRGSENIGQDDLVIPRLEIIQALSPQVKQGDAKYIEEAKAGMLVNSVSQQLYGREAFVIPVMFIKQWLVWGKRKWIDEQGREQKSEGGFFGAFNTPEEANARMEAEVKDNGTNARGIEVIDTPQHLCLLINPDTGKTEEIMISMPKTKAKISRQWNSMVRMAGGDPKISRQWNSLIRMNGGDRFSRVYRIGTAMEKNKQGEDYLNFTVTKLGFPAKPLYLRAEELYKQMQAGRAVTMDVTGYEVEQGGDKPAVDADDAEM